MTPNVQRAAVRSAVAPLFAEPSVSSVQISQLLAGHPIEMLEERDGWWRVRGLDRYEGWMHRGYLGNGELHAAEMRLPSRLALGCVTAHASGRRALPLGAYLEADEQVLSGEIVTSAERSARFPLQANAITGSARRYFEGTSYLWGGVTPWGADCSGLVQSCFALHGLLLPRDAWQQASQGEPGEDSPLDAREGDLLFFSDREDRRVTHVAISMGGSSIVHLALGRGGYAIDRLDDDRDPYVRSLRERFAFARRVLPATTAPRD
jgi:hypothetical protein